MERKSNRPARTESKRKACPLWDRLLLLSGHSIAGTAAQKAQQAGEHIEEQLSTLRTSFAALSDNVEASAKQFSVTEDINDMALQAIRASVPTGYLPTGLMRGR